MRKTNRENSRKQTTKFYVVDHIVDAREGADGTMEYLVKWKNFPASRNTWEPVHHLEEVMDIVEKFH